MQVPFTQAVGKGTNGRDWGAKFGGTVPSTRESGERICPTGEVASLSLTVTNTSASGRRDSRLGWASFNPTVESRTRERGSGIRSANKCNGFGCYLDASGNNTYHGNWRRGEMDGFGVFSWANERIYEGEYRKDEKFDRFNCHACCIGCSCPRVWNSHLRKIFTDVFLER
ncbi:hypothetical protein NCLIV_022870 [Neospora caninum Liverpool]|uniref:MORN repeat-containing protein n=1 Tax=Neospora caninum (strain Liverpool) TaxID=572307 RepID=F0VFK4_NEOCL|nr:hypothetical protein NCLIV_022870 [Neospora caninum Liverpool]CBZ52498.1 hypothetical protein NCLIV_022870 [Neospora caninum Liverpool]CEL66475.1 TPA: hypothetical protein BN1204_022870 [Neospora caninum Liverpool]|eukprot:XP_003882530.1 hypothetical protein NCLIV_022870 [Neospora caninum Liverpool]